VLTMRDFPPQPPVVTSPRRRVCAEPGCHTTLSIYNHGRYCVLHEEAECVAGEMAQCRKCGEILPLTEEFFVRDRYRASGWAPYCKACKRGYKRGLYEKHRLNRDSGTEQAICRQCRETKPRDGDHWSFGHNGRLVQPCLECQAENMKQRKARTLDQYYRRRYGMTRAEYKALHSGSRDVIVVSPRGAMVQEVV